MRIAFYTLGCKVNQYETQILTQIFAADGYDVVSHTDLADVYVVNSCTVTATGDRKTRQMLRQFKARNPAAKVCFRAVSRRRSPMPPSVSPKRT